MHFEEIEYWGYSWRMSLSTRNTLRLLLFFGQIWVLALIFNTLIDHTACNWKVKVSRIWFDLKEKEITTSTVFNDCRYLTSDNTDDGDTTDTDARGGGGFMHGVGRGESSPPAQFGAQYGANWRQQIQSKTSSLPRGPPTGNCPNLSDFQTIDWLQRLNANATKLVWFQNAWY